MAELKFNRKYLLYIQNDDDVFIRVEPPLTIEFDITRNTLSSANVAQIRVYNLSPLNRNAIRKNLNDYGNNKRVTLYAGYNNNLSTIFDGWISQCWSVREGTNFVTQIESFDGGFAYLNANTEQNFSDGSTSDSVIESLFASLERYGVKTGHIGDFPVNVTSRGKAYSGSTTGLLRELTGARFFIDNGKAYALADNECIEGALDEVNPDSGILNTPIREQTYVYVDILFEPRVYCGQLLRFITGATEENLSNFTTLQRSILDKTGINTGINNDYKVVSVKHRGTISEAVCGTAITTIGLFQPLSSESLSVVT